LNAPPTTWKEAMNIVQRTAEELYLDLLKRCLTREVIAERYAALGPEFGSLKHRLLRPLQALLATRGLELTRQLGMGELGKGHGRPEGETMIGLQRLDSLQRCIADVLDRGVPGDLIETGVWRGGTTIFMRAALEAYGDQDRQVWVADSFQGLPKPDPERFPADADNQLWSWTWVVASQQEVEANFARYGLLDERVRFLPGWFADTLPAAPIERLAVLRLDGDMYSSTMEALEHLYPKLSAGGYVIVDDYGAYPECRQAVTDYRTSHDIADPIDRVDEYCVLWKRS
jgi:O-methyltransferase